MDTYHDLLRINVRPSLSPVSGGVTYLRLALDDVDQWSLGGGRCSHRCDTLLSIGTLENRIQEIGQYDQQAHNFHGQHWSVSITSCFSSKNIAELDVGQRGELVLALRNSTVNRTITVSVPLLR